MSDFYSYKEGYREGVLFAFYREGQVLLEDRGLGFDKEAFFPNGSIEEKDKEDTEDYVKTALFREIREEFAGKIEVNKLIYLGELKVDEINVIFYIYCIVDWKGTFPKYIVEVGEKDSKIKMFPLDEARKIVKYNSAYEILDRINNLINTI